MKNVGVDIRVFFNGIMDGNHCMKFAERGDSIMAEMTKVTLKLITDTRLVALINRFNILQLWFGCMRFMKRTGRHTRADITSFQNSEGQRASSGNHKHL